MSLADGQLNANGTITWTIPKAAGNVIGIQELPIGSTDEWVDAPVIAQLPKTATSYTPTSTGVMVHVTQLQFEAGALTINVPTPTPVAPPTITGTTYYVSPTGNDNNSGTSPSAAWKTVNRVNHASLAPGDGVLFQAGASFSDAVLMPPSSGTQSKPIVFGSYGTGQAVITQGAWFVQNDLAFENLGFGSTFYGGSNTQGTSNDILLDQVTIQMADGNQSLGLFGNGTGWTIENSTVNNSGLSGMLLWGSGYLVTGNTITNTGAYTGNGYNNHGIYLDASDTTITNNRISNFEASGISVRYHGSTIQGNTISNGEIGIDFFQTDTVAGTAMWKGNKISGTTTAGIYISPSGSGGDTMESFIIEDNVLDVASGVFMNLSPSTGTQTVENNTES